MYDRLYLLCDKHILLMIRNNIINNHNNNNYLILNNPNQYLLPIKKLWDDHREEINAIRRVLLMLDRTYVRQETDCKSLWKMGIILKKLMKIHPYV